MTQLIIAGVETVLPQQFSVAVKRENPFFTKSGEYTYDCTLRLDNPVNQQLYGFLHRLNRVSAPAGSPGGSPASLATRRTAMLIADGHVYCRGTEVITKWTDQTVSIQIVSGESELNWLVGQEQKIEDLDLGTISGSVAYLDSSQVYPAVDYCLAPVRTAEGETLNNWTFSQSTPLTNPVAQPYVCALIRRLMSALGYTVHTNQLEETQMKYLFLINQLHTTEYAKMLPGWTVKDFLAEIERLTGCVFVTDNLTKTVDILLKTVFYQDARQIPLQDVVDEYETEVQDGDGDAEFTASDVSYSLPSHRWAQLMKLPEDLKLTATYVDCADIDNVVTTASSYEATEKVILRDLSTGRLYIRMLRTYTATGTGGGTFGGSGVSSGGQTSEQTEQEDYMLLEVDQFCDLNRADTDSVLELKITPAPMAFRGTGCEVIDLCSTDGYKGGRVDDDSSSESEEEEDKFEDLIRSYSKQESSAIDLYCAFHNGTHLSNGWPVIYTDAGHAAIQRKLYPNGFNSAGPYTDTAGSLRLQDLDADHYQGAYQIDTAHAVTFQTFNPNHIDVRQVYVIQNRRFVVRDVEETITAEGRAPLWKLTCYPIQISDEAIENRWVLTRGVWDDGGAWLDTGRWNDGAD